MAFVRNARPVRGYPLLILALAALVLPGLPSCGTGQRPLAPRSQTWAELRTVRAAVSVTLPGESSRKPYPRERLVDGQKVHLEGGALAWVRRDGGATLLVRGPAELTVFADSTELSSGQVFIDTPPNVTTRLVTPAGPLQLANVRSSLEISDGSVSAYVLAGEVRAGGDVRARAGERITVRKGDDAPATVEPTLVWEDWTGGLATTDRVAQPAPFGVGTVGARLPGALGTARYPLAIRRLDVNVTIDGDFAVTEVDQTFFNPRSRRVEGIYRFRAPPDAALSRFGVNRGAELVWGRVKERRAAAAQYRANVYAGSTEDPALLEWEAPGVYRARLYPIEPGESRRVVVRYTQWLGRTGPQGERRTYVYPMAAEGTEESIPRIEELTVTLDLARARAKEVRAGMAGVRAGDRLIVRAQDHAPRADLAVELFDDGLDWLRGYRAKHAPDLEALPPSERKEAERSTGGEADYVLVPIRASQVPLPKGGLDLAIVVDASAASEPGAMSIARAATGALLAHLGDDDRAVVWAGAEDLRPVVGGLDKPAPVDASTRRRILAGLATFERGGATDLGSMLTAAAAALDPERRGAVVYIGDGRPTVGELSLGDLKERLEKLARPVRIFGLGVGSDVDMAILAGLARGAFAERIGDGHAAARAALRLLEQAERPVWLGASVDLGPLVERVYPRDLSTLVADETVLVVGRTKSSRLPKTVAVSGPEGARQITLRPNKLDDRGDLRRRWALGRLGRLLDEGAGRAAMVDLGSRFGIITPVTSLYVPTSRELESETGKKRRKRRVANKLDSETPAEEADDREGGSGTRARGESGVMGKASTKRSNRRYGVAGPRDNPDPHIARQSALREAQEFGMIGVLESAAGGDPNAPTAPWGGDDTAREPADAKPEASPVPSAKSGEGSLDMDGVSPMGNMWGSEIGDALGGGGLGLEGKPADQSKSSLQGAGKGGGGRGEGIGLGAVGTLGSGAGTGTGQGFGSGHGRLGASRNPPVPRVRMGATTVTGKLPPEVVRRIVRQSFGRFRLCYETGLKTNPNLQGRVGVRFRIARDGSVHDAANAGSDLPSGDVVACVVRAFSKLSFPQPEGGSVNVTYPITFSPGGPRQPSAAPAAASASVTVTRLPRRVIGCSTGAIVPLRERIVLWRERLMRSTGNPAAVAAVYRRALSSCEAPTWRERRRLLSLLLDALPQVSDRVSLWRMMFADLGAADALYRGIVARVKTPKQMRQLHDALGLKSIDPGLLEKVIARAPTPARRVAKLRELVVEWPDDFALALRLLDALEDAGDRGGARDLARLLRARPEVNAAVRTAVGELYLRLSKHAKSAEQKKADIADARRTFGEIVEFAPDDPVARRRLGDLLRAHGWYAEAKRQYETLARLTPDDSNVALLLAAADEGQGKLEAAVRWIEKGGSAGAPDVDRSPASTARAIASTYLAWGRIAARSQGKSDELGALTARAKRVHATDRAAVSSAVRVTLTWSHPDFHPTLWSNALGSPMPAPEGDVTLGISQVRMPKRSGSFVEVRVEKDEVEHASRLAAEAVLTVAFDELEKEERLVRVPVTFERDGPPRIRFRIAEGQVTRE